MDLKPTHQNWPVIALLALAMTAFAAKSRLTRAALTDPANYALSFPIVRHLSGAAGLAPRGSVAG